MLRSTLLYFVLQAIRCSPVLGEKEPIKRYVMEDGFKPPIFGSYSYEPIKDIFEPPRNGPTKKPATALGDTFVSTTPGDKSTTKDKNIIDEIVETISSIATTLEVPEIPGNLEVDIPEKIEVEKPEVPELPGKVDGIPDITDALSGYTKHRASDDETRRLHLWSRSNHIL